MVINIGMRKSKLSTYKQRHLIEHFVAGSTARTAASICNVNHKTAAFYYHRLREIIAYELEQEADAVFAGEIDVDERATLEVSVKDDMAVVLRGKPQFLAYLSVVVRFIRKLSQMLDQQHCSRS